MDSMVASDLGFQSGFGNEFATEALPFESRYLYGRPTRFALETELLQTGYHECWAELENHFTGTSRA